MFSNRENVFYLAFGLVALLHEFAIESGLYLFLSIPLALGVVAVGLWAFKK